MKTREVLATVALISVLGLAVTAVAGTVPPRYRDVRIFMDPDGPGGIASSTTPYDPCARYDKSLKYTVSGVIGVMLGANGYSFNLRDVVAQAAAIWNNKLASNGCSFSIVPANISAPNFVINSDQSDANSTAIAVAVPRGYEKLTGVPPGIYVNRAYPITYSQDESRVLATQFDADMNGEQIAQALALLTMVHEFGHALGLAHPIEEMGNQRDGLKPRYSPHSMQWISRADFASGPVMIGNPIRLLDVMVKTPQKHRLKLSDMQPSDVEANTLKQLLSCSSIQAAKDAQQDAACSSFLSQGKLVLQYSDLYLPFLLEKMTRTQ
jgi:hypothetical protein